jgi:hypothetical protein
LAAKAIAVAPVPSSKYGGGLGFTPTPGMVWIGRPSPTSTGEFTALMLNGF